MLRCTVLWLNHQMKQYRGFDLVTPFSTPLLGGKLLSFRRMKAEIQKIVILILPYQFLLT